MGPRAEAGTSTQWHFSISLATGQQLLHGQYQRWVQAHLQGLRRAAFWGWQQAAARRRHMMARSEQLLLQRWVGWWWEQGGGSSAPWEKQGESPGGHEGRPQLGAVEP